jgi:UDP-glucose 4-epimerase
VSFESKEHGCGRVVITGGAGFIGSTLCRRLLRRGVPVVIYDSLAGGERVAQNVEQLQQQGAAFVHGDIRDGTVLARTLQPGDGVVHLAAIASVPISVADPKGCQSVNVIGTTTVLKQAVARQARRAVFASTAALYGARPSLPSTENDPLSPASPYADSKLFGEREMAASGIPAVSLRLFNVYGPGQDPKSSYSGVITRWIDALRRGETIDLYGDGSQTRDFVHVEDVAAALEAALVAPGKAPGPINIGSGEQTSLLQLLEGLSSLFGVQPEIRRHETRAGDVPHSCADIRRARAFLGYTPAVGLRDGLRTLVEAER